MSSEKVSVQFVQNLLAVLPSWNARLVRPFRDTLNKEMSLETYYCLETIKLHDSVTMTELSQYLKVPKQQVTKLVDKLSQYQFIERIYEEKDRRMIRIRLTNAAVSYIDEYYLKNTKFIENMEEKLTKEELEQLNRAMATLRELLPKLK